jgi:hypothetical protein
MPALSDQPRSDSSNGSGDDDGSAGPIRLHPMEHFWLHALDALKRQLEHEPNPDDREQPG